MSCIPYVGFSQVINEMTDDDYKKVFSKREFMTTPVGISKGEGVKYFV